MFVLDIWVLRSLLRLRESSLKAGADPEAAVEVTRDITGHGELGELLSAHNTMLRELANSRRRDRAMAEERARFLTHHDVSTGLPNRAALVEFLERQREAGTTLLFLNVLRFRLFNATYGAEAGDRLLAELARRLCATAAPGDFVARLGDDRFALARGGGMRPDEAAALAERVLAAAAAPFAIQPDTVLSPAVRIGIAKDTALRGHELVAQAELALGRTSEDGGAKYAFFSAALAEQAKERQALARDLEQAIERGELPIALQPKVGLAVPDKRALAGAEVLLRWRHPARGHVSPAVFIPIAEATGLILAIGEFVLRASCAQMRAWLDRYGTSPRLAVNLSAHQFRQADLADRLARVLREFDIPRGFLEVEITESSAMADVERTAAILAELRELGVGVSIDDFGTGYSSLAYLRRFAVDAIKIDKSFVDDLGADAHADTICDAILRLGQSLGTKVIAEGVEREDQATFLRHRRCDEAQGWLFGKPIPAAEFEKVWLMEKAAA
jgi:diguanylate cyclase (GGDEF)-like protein